MFYALLIADVVVVWRCLPSRSALMPFGEQIIADFLQSFYIDIWGRVPVYGLRTDSVLDNCKIYHLYPAVLKNKSVISRRPVHLFIAFETTGCFST